MAWRSILTCVPLCAPEHWLATAAALAIAAKAAKAATRMEGSSIFGEVVECRDRGIERSEEEGKGERSW